MNEFQGGPGNPRKPKGPSPEEKERKIRHEAIEALARNLNIAPQQIFEKISDPIKKAGFRFFIISILGERRRKINEEESKVLKIDKRNARFGSNISKLNRKFYELFSNAVVLGILEQSDMARILPIERSAQAAKPKSVTIPLESDGGTKGILEDLAEKCGVTSVFFRNLNKEDRRKYLVASLKVMFDDLALYESRNLVNDQMEIENLSTKIFYIYERSVKFGLIEPSDMDDLYPKD